MAEISRRDTHCRWTLTGDPLPAHIRLRRSIHHVSTRLCNCHLAGIDFDAYSNSAHASLQTYVRKRLDRRPRKHIRSLFTIEALVRSINALSSHGVSCVKPNKLRRAYAHAHRHNRALRLPVNRRLVRCANYDNDLAMWITSATKGETPYTLHLRCRHADLRREIRLFV